MEAKVFILLVPSSIRLPDSEFVPIAVPVPSRQYNPRDVPAVRRPP
jgi:hypothetical protein